jgi:hypothetical protein
MKTISCNQRLWRIPFISARREVNRNLKQPTKIGEGPFIKGQKETTQNDLARSVGLDNSVLDFPPAAAILIKQQLHIDCKAARA